MAGNTSPIFELTPFNHGVTFTSADTTSEKTIMTAGTNGSRVDSISLCTNDTAAVDLAFYINDGTNDYYIGDVSLTPGVGYNGTLKIDGMTSLQPAAQSFIQLAAGYTLKAGCVATMTSGKTTTVVAIGGDF